MRWFLVSVLLLSPYLMYAQENILVAAASDLKFAVDSLIAVFRQAHTGSVNATYNSSGKLTEQITNGAPFDIFLSADISYPEKLKANGKTASEIHAYARGHLVLWSRKVNPNTNREKTLLDPDVEKIAIANPRHAPYGKRAIESLEFYELRDAVSSKLVYGENISQTAQFVLSGAADIGIIALSLAKSPAMQKQGGQYYLIPEESHDPLIQGAVITSHGKNKRLAHAFFEFIKGQEAVGILEYFGFTKP